MGDLGEGTFGLVTKGRDRESGCVVAMKKVKIKGQFSGFPTTSLREIKFLKMLSHENIVKLVEVVTAPPSDENRGRYDGVSNVACAECNSCV